MAGILKPNNVLQEGRFTINGYYSKYNYPNHNKGEYLFDANVNTSFCFYYLNDYIDITLHDACNVWTICRDVGGIPEYCKPLTVYKMNEQGAWELTTIQDKRTEDIKWTKTYEKVPAGRYKFVKEDSGYRADGEWYLECLVPLYKFNTYII